jgi:signal peptidase I
MKCPNCGYFNLPGAIACGQCRRSLEAGSTPGANAAVPMADIYPPRAAKRSASAQIDAHSPIARRAKRVAERDWRRTREDALNARTEIWNWQLALQWWIPPLLSLIPGLGQLWQRRFLMGAIFFATTTLLVLLGIATFFAVPSNYFFAAAILTAWWGIRDAAEHSFPPAPENVRRWRSLRLSLLAITIVSLTICTAFWLASWRYALWNVVGNQGAPVMQAGDALVVERFQTENPLLELERGDIVVAYFGVERVLGLPGDRVIFENGIVRVNGKAVSKNKMPLNFDARSRPFATKVPPGQVLLWQTMLGNIEEYNGVATTYRLVDEDQLEGRAIGIYNPPSRRRRFSGTGDAGSTP